VKLLKHTDAMEGTIGAGNPRRDHSFPVAYRLWGSEVHQAHSGSV